MARKSQVLQRTAAGLYTQYNPHTAPEGSLVLCENFRIYKPGVVTKSRGLNRYGTMLGASALTLMEFLDRLVFLDGTTIKYDSDGAGTWASWSGIFSPPDASTRIRSTQARSTLYFTTSTGIYKTDALTTSPTEAGLPAPNAASYEDLNVVAAGHFLLAQYQCSYRAVFTREDANGRLVVSAPTRRMIVKNWDATLTQYNVIRIGVPAGVIAGDKCEIYRAAQTPFGTDPGDEHYLVQTHTLASGATTGNRSFSITDDLPDSLISSQPLYTNATQEGVAQLNYQPPFAKDIATYKGYTFYSNVRQPHSVEFRLVDFSAISDGDVLTVNYDSSAYNFTAKTTRASTDDWLIYTGHTTDAENIETTISSNTYSLISRINRYARANPNTVTYAEYVSEVDDPPGMVRLFALDAADKAIEVTASSATFGDAWDPPLQTTTGASGAVISTQPVEKNVIYYSKADIPDAVPPGNRIPVGSEDSAILRILPLRESLIILKEDGIHRLTGYSPSDFVVKELDQTARLFAPETAVVLNNVVFCLTNQGVVRVDPFSGVSIISIPIEDDLKAVMEIQGADTLCHAVAYESEREYWLFVPDSASDTSAQRAYIYNYVTRQWYTRVKAAKAAHVVRSERRLYLAHGDDAYILQERKSLLGTADFVDETITETVTAKGTTTDADGNTVVTVTVGSWSYATTPSEGWLFTYGGTDDVVTAVTDNGGGSYTMTLSTNFAGLPSNFSASFSIPIVSTLIWTPESAGNPSTLKQFFRYQIDFLENRAWKHEVEFATNYVGDKSAVSSPIVIKTPGWGSGSWNSPAWGAGEPLASPIALHVPTDCQRAQWYVAKYRHRYAKENVEIVNTSMTFRPLGERTVRQPT